MLLDELDIFGESSILIIRFLARLVRINHFLDFSSGKLA